MHWSIRPPNAGVRQAIIAPTTLAYCGLTRCFRRYSAQCSRKTSATVRVVLLR
ncbi:MAG: hypothetical protein HS114_15600 [Anaerolineales bacterium]|nr:hypothetical protein [Anaerolineales bacterium]